MIKKKYKAPFIKIQVSIHNSQCIRAFRNAINFEFWMIDFGGNPNSTKSILDQKSL